MAIPIKKKPCKTCNQLSYIFSHGNCKDCSTRLKMSLRQSDTVPAKPFKVKYQTKEIKKVSTKQQLLNKAYSAQRKVYLKNHPDCEVRIEGCFGIATDIHHIKSRGQYMLDKSEWLATCRFCHDFIHSHHSWAVEKGFIKSKLTL